MQRFIWLDGGQTIVRLADGALWRNFLGIDKVVVGRLGQNFIRHDQVRGVLAGRADADAALRAVILCHGHGGEIQGHGHKYRRGHAESQQP